MANLIIKEKRNPYTLEFVIIELQTFILLCSEFGDFN